MYHVCDECVCVACPNQKRIAGRLCNTKQYMNATSMLVEYVWRVFLSIENKRRPITKEDYDGLGRYIEYDMNICIVSYRKLCHGTYFTESASQNA